MQPPAEPWDLQAGQDGDPHHLLAYSQSTNSIHLYPSAPCLLSFFVLFLCSRSTNSIHLDSHCWRLVLCCPRAKAAKSSSQRCRGRGEVLRGGWPSTVRVLTTVKIWGLPSMIFIMFLSLCRLVEPRTPAHAWRKCFLIEPLVSASLTPYSAVSPYPPIPSCCCCSSQRNLKQFWSFWGRSIHYWGERAILSVFSF